MMKHWDRNIIVIARLKAKPLLAGQVISALAFAALAWGQAAPVRQPLMPSCRLAFGN